MRIFHQEQKFLAIFQQPKIYGVAIAPLPCHDAAGHTWQNKPELHITLVKIVDCYVCACVHNVCLWS